MTFVGETVGSRQRENKQNEYVGYTNHQASRTIVEEFSWSFGHYRHTETKQKHIFFYPSKCLGFPVSSFGPGLIVSLCKNCFLKLFGKEKDIFENLRWL